MEIVKTLHVKFFPLDRSVQKKSATVKLISRKKFEEHDVYIKTEPTETKALRQFANRLISKENILSKFQKVEIEL